MPVPPWQYGGTERCDPSSGGVATFKVAEFIILELIDSATFTYTSSENEYITRSQQRDRHGASRVREGRPQSDAPHQKEEYSVGQH
eukprot:scaffold13088_cov56-Phaeocystis_antarctica.AAC.10